MNDIKKRKMKKIIYSFAIVAMAMFMGACEDLLDLQPQQSLSVGDALSDFDGVTTALIGAYDKLQDVDLYGRNTLVMPEASGDNVILTLDNSNRFTQNALNVFTISNGDVEDQWTDWYNVILRVNTIINNIDGVSGGSQADRDQVLGEALFLRALAHFEMVRGFAQPISTGGGSNPGIPIILVSEIGEPARNTVGEVYNQIVADLTSSVGLMTNAQAPFRASTDAARALLSRVYLYMEDNANVVSMADAVINSGNYGLEPTATYLASWETDGGQEEIFTARFLGNETLGSDNLGNIYIQEGYGDLRASQDIMDALSGAGDIRIQFIRNVAGDDYQYKFPGQLGVPGLASPRILRLAEMHLNRAEANAKLGNFAAAITDLNLIRNRAGLASITPADADVLTEVLAERRRELAWEGHRTYDLFRNGLDMVRVECNAISACTISAGADDAIWPIPEKEMEANPNMVQNPGY